jgi:flavin reductase (DIM6/NTAB) family NADH-FMN oxidoreductase RutF
VSDLPTHDPTCAGFDALMADVDRTMIIVTTASRNVRAGCLVGFHSQAGIEPAGYAVWLSKANHTYRIGALSEHFAVHLLSKEHHDLAELFGATTQDEVDKFERCEWSPGPDGVPLLDSIGNRFVGRRRAWLDPGSDHICLIVSPILADRTGGPTDWLRLADVADVTAAHTAQERQQPG